MPIDYSKWDKIADSDDDEDEAPAKSTPTSKSAAEKENTAPLGPAADGEHGKPLDDAPKLDLNEESFVSFYKKSMTAPQRMQTMVHLWNSSPQDERVEFLRKLIDMIDDPKVSNKIKGGQEILKDLDTSFYCGVTYPQHWVEEFSSSLTVEQKKLVFQKLFTALDQSERGLVLGTLM